MVDRGRCPHCETMLSGEDVDRLEVESVGVGPMGTGSSGGVLFVCPSCRTILG